MTPPRDGPAKPPGFKPHGFRPRPRMQQRPGPAAREGHDHVVLYGWHPVSQALANSGRRFHRLLATENALARLKETLPELPIEPEIVRPSAIDRLLGPDAVHQGLYAEAEHLEAPALDAMPDDALLLALDQITDPHNVGAIVRTAAAFGVTAIVTTARHSPNATGVLAKSASGGLEHVPLVVVRNLAEALITLGERGFTRIGLDSEAGIPLDTVTPRRPAVLVLGAEGKGLRQRTTECCDLLVRIDAVGAIRSLNVSNAAAITLYALTRPSAPTA